MDKKNILTISVLPVICLVIFFLPLNFKELLVLKISNITFWNWFSCNFVHFDYKHLLGNIFVYFFSIFFICMLSPEEFRKKIGYVILGIIILFPILNLIIHLIAVEFNNTSKEINIFGFSGISSALLGVLCFAIAKKFQVLIDNKKDKNIFKICSGIFIFLFLFVIIPEPFNWIFFLVVLFLVIFLLKIEKNCKNLMFIAALIFLSCSIFWLFPKQIRAEGVFINNLAHFIGFFSGFLIGFSFLKNK